MSDIGLPHCARCGCVENDCTCDEEGKCFSCGRKLSKKEIADGREQCFKCYREDQE
jgi:hypothetical protein